ncbi:MAG: tetratricopeptide repeat protein [Cyanobacteria bacterium SBLK]|nr:tetratricopeptide repeat protein [Cyanobacteria bacterium SBLK]
MKMSEEILAQLNAVIQRDPCNTRAIARRGETYRSLKQYEKALGDFNRAIALKPDYAWAIARRGETYRLLENYSEAIADFDGAIALQPDYAWAYAHRGMTYRLWGEPYYRQALGDFSRAIELQPDYAWAIAYRARIHDLLRCYEEALADFDRAMALDKHKNLFDHWQCERGLLLSYCGQYAEAIASCKEVLRENTEDSFALYNIAVFKARWHGLTEARPEIDRARSVLLSLVGTEEQGLAIYRLGGLAAIEGQTELALSYLEKSVLLDTEAREFALHDVAWLDLRANPSFRAITS